MSDHPGVDLSIYTEQVLTAQHHDKVCYNLDRFVFEDSFKMKNNFAVFICI